MNCLVRDREVTTRKLTKNNIPPNQMGINGCLWIVDLGWREMEQKLNLLFFFYKLIYSYF